MSRRAIVRLAALVLACDAGPDADAEPEADGASEPAQDGFVAIRPERRCGESGRHPTKLPPDLEAGMEPIDVATLHAGDSRTVGTMTMHYDASIAMLPYYGGDVVVSDAAAPDQWGTRFEVRPAEKDVRQVGLHFIDFASAGEEPLDVAVAITRPRCPAEALLQQNGKPQSMWLSTEAIREHELEPSTDALAIRLARVDEGPVVSVTEGGYAMNVRVYPWTKTQVRANTHVVRIDEVVAGPDTRFEHGAWTAPMRPKLHVRVSIEPVAKTPAIAARDDAKGCGGGSSAPTRTPAALTRVVPVVDDFFLASDQDQDATAGPFELTFGTPGAFLYWNEVRATTPDGIVARLMPHRDRDAVGRVARSLLLLEASHADDATEVRVRRLQLACPPTLVRDGVDEPTYVWLSTVGHRTLTIGEPVQLELELEPDLHTPKLYAADTERVYASTVAPALVGDAFTVGDWDVEIVDVTSSFGTGFHERTWRSRAAFPAVHVQLRIAESS